MPKVLVLIKDTNKTLQLEEEHARRIATADPNSYQILERPVIEPKTIPPIEKKKDVVAVEKSETVQDIVQETPKRGRPKK